MDVPHLARIALFPIKSLDSVEVSTARVMETGPLEFDRRFALLDESGAWINAKRTPRIQRLRSRCDPAAMKLSLLGPDSNDWVEFHLVEERAALEEWLGAYFGSAVRVHEDPELGFPDDPQNPGPTLISRATLEAVASWYPRMSLDEARRRSRANLEIDGVPAFWEDQLFAALGDDVPFRVGPVRLLGTNPCQRCAVPGRSSRTGEVDAQFAQVFARQREALLPAWANRSRFDHYYRLAVNTRLVASDSAGMLRLGDEVALERC